MSEGKLFLGVDTSNYTTSLAVADEKGNVIANIKKLLPVASGERGLRQSDALFAHTKQLPELLDKLSAELAKTEAKPCAVGYSSSPRDAEGSYMPCFLAGEAAAHALACSASLPVFSSSHQAGHIMAALYSAGKTDLAERDFISFHVSGGTTDVLYVKPHREKVFDVEKIGGTLDINAGQAIDRSGVMMGFGFPAGASLEKAQLSCTKKPPRPKICVKGFECNLSGLENKAKELYESTNDIPITAAYVFEFVSQTLLAITNNLRERYPDMPILYAGGVMSSVTIKSRLEGANSYFASPEFSSDNAAGCALICRRKYLGIGG